MAGALTASLSCAGVIAQVPSALATSCTPAPVSSGRAALQEEGAGFKQFSSCPKSPDAAKAYWDVGADWSGGGRDCAGRDFPALKAHGWFLFLTSLLRTKKDEHRCMLLPT